MRRDKFAFALGTGILALAISGIAMADAGQQAPLTLDVQARETLLPDRTLLSLEFEDTGRDASGILHRKVLVPADAGEVTCRLLSGEATLAPLRDLGLMRGRRIYSLTLENPSPGLLEIEVRHDGNWNTASRTASRSFDALLGIPAGTGGRDGAPAGGSYVIISAPVFAGAAETLADWKQRKGFPVVTVTTDETGGTNASILDWLQAAYDSWDLPPEYVLLLGDVGTIPAWNFSGNVSDHPYTLLDGDDWLPDVFLGRLSVETPYQAETVVYKSIAYERDPYFEEGDEWFTRSVLVAGNYGSSTPITTVEWCGQQLESIGFEPATEPYTGNGRAIYFPPYWSQPHLIDMAIEEGASMVIYRGWAYGVKGWEPPHFTTDEIPAVENGGKTPVVMSFVCLNGDFSVDEVCFGESWIRQGSPTERKGGVAFIGNGEHWSHTRYNDAMALAYFDRIVDENITDLGLLSTAGKLRFLDYFPHELDETGDEQSVEFYFHIYILLGDPELNFYKSAPEPMTVTHDVNYPVGVNHLSLAVTNDGGAPLGGVRVGVVQDGELLACAFTNEAGEASLPLAAALGEGFVSLTVTAPGYRTYEAEVAVGEAEIFLAVSDRNPASVAPGTEISLKLELENRGTNATPAFNAVLATDHPGVTMLDNEAGFDAMTPGESDICAGDFSFRLDATLADGALIPFSLATYDGSEALFDLRICAPALRVQSADPDMAVDPGATLNLTLALLNEGACGSAGMNATLQLLTPGATVLGGEAAFAAVDAGGVVSNADSPFVLEIAPDTAPGTGLQFLLNLVGNEGFETALNFAILVGDGDINQPIGPDAHGYYAYDSADIDFPASRPDYDWQVLSTRYGGEGTELEFPEEGGLPGQGNALAVTLPFTFRYYGGDHDQLLISDNGWASFDLDNSLDFYNWPIPSAYGNHSVLAPFWDNFAVALGDSVTDAAYRDGVYEYSDGGVYTIEWSQMRHYLPEVEAFQTFQLKLYDPAMYPTDSGDGEIVFLYKQVANVDGERNYATVGIESPDETDGIQLSYADLYARGAAPLSPGLAVRFTTDPPVYDPLTLALGKVLRQDGGWRLLWEPSDDRPVLGWKVWRGDELLTPAPLPASAREFTDPSGGEGEYRLSALHPFGQETEFAALRTLGDLRLMPASPNPASNGTWIGFSMDQDGPARLRIYDPAGRLVRELLSGPVLSGEQTRFWDGRDEAGHRVASGVYFYRLEAGGRSLTRKLVMVR